jgi:predicted ester cyclase
MPATGQKVSVPGLDFYHIKDGKIVEFWHHADTLGMIQQLSSDVE